MAQSQIDIWKSTCVRLGINTLISPTDISPQATILRTQYDNNRRAELRKYVWSFSIKRVQLPSTTITPAFGYNTAFNLPDDFIRLIRPYETNCDWVIEGGQILSNNNYSSSGSILNLRYVSDVKDVTLFDSLFYDTLSISLAIDCCEALTNSSSKKQILLEEYRQSINSAKKAGAIEKGPISQLRDEYLDYALS